MTFATHMAACTPTFITEVLQLVSIVQLVKCLLLLNERLIATALA